MRISFSKLDGVFGTLLTLGCFCVGAWCSANLANAQDSAPRKRVVIVQEDVDVETDHDAKPGKGKRIRKVIKLHPRHDLDLHDHADHDHGIVVTEGGDVHTIVPSKFYFGIVANPLDNVLRKHLKLKDGEGVLISRVLKDSPAEKAGITKHDIILSANGQGIGNMHDLLKTLKDMKEPKNFSFEVLQNGDKKTFSVLPAVHPGFKSSIVMTDRIPNKIRRHIITNDIKLAPSGRIILNSSGHIPAAGEHLILMPSLPKNTSISIVKKNNDTAEIIIRKNGKEWTFKPKDKGEAEDLLKAFYNTAEQLMLSKKNIAKVQGEKAKAKLKYRTDKGDRTLEVPALGAWPSALDFHATLPSASFAPNVSAHALSAEFQEHMKRMERNMKKMREDMGRLRKEIMKDMEKAK